MFCVNCGVELADTEKKCPLCETIVYHPEIKQNEVRSLYPSGMAVKIHPNSRVFNGITVILFIIPLLICFLADLQRDGVLNWFGFAAGGLILAYIAFALPRWFKKPNPIIFVPCFFAATILYLWYINFLTNGSWFLSFAFPVAGVLMVIVCTVVTLIYCLDRGKLYIFGGGFIALGLSMVLFEFLLNITFGIRFIGWSVYPLIVLMFLGGTLIYLAINSTARETMERKLFF